MANLNLFGCGTALITPFTKSGEVDYPALESLVKTQISAGINFLVPLGTTAETPCLTNEEKLKIFEICKKNSDGHPLVVGVGTNSFEHTKANIDLLAPLKPDAFLVVTPYYNKPTQTGLKAYYTALADYAPAPIVIYNVPGRTGVNIASETTLALAKHPNIAAIKEASGNYAQISKIIGEAPKEFTVLSGNDDETLSLMATGAKGVISVVSHLAPKEMAELTSAMLAGSLDKARAIHHRLFPLFKACFVESNPIPVKAGLAAMGVIENVLRLPLTPSSESTDVLIKSILKNLNLI